MVQQLFLGKRLKIFVNYILGPVLFVWLSWSIYRQVQRQSDVQRSWGMIKAAVTGELAWKIGIVVLLMLLNWGIEARKWQVLVRSIQKVSFLRAYRAIFSGQALAFNTINRMGESAGRAIFLDEGNRIRGTLLSVVGSMGQMLVTLLMGIVALVYMRINILDETHRLGDLSGFWMDCLMSVLCMGLVIYLILYFRISWVIGLLEKVPLVAKYRFFVQKLEEFHYSELAHILLLSFCRYLVYVFQYIVLLQVFDVQVHWLDAACMACVLFLVMAIVPTIALAELGFRGKLSIQLFGLLSGNTIGIVATAAGIWIINLIIPAIAGSLFILGIRLFRNR